MTTKAQSKPVRRKTPVARKTITRRPTAETAGEGKIPAPSKRKATETSVAKVTPASAAEPASGTRPTPGSKLGMVLALLEKPQGASLAKLVEVTGWLPHTTRAALTGLRKRGFAVVSEKAEGGGASVYRLYGKVA
ncbi:DUF3489 domain-containing protein [Xanthobacter autotrophicus]|uniref:DUF3489 domain-containing protein n=1 Tax=Xanthobacter autotrophicus TaxID=280 RepID=UPI00372B0584